MRLCSLRHSLLASLSFPAASELMHALALPPVPTRRKTRQVCERIASELRAVGADEVALIEQRWTSHDEPFGVRGNPEVDVESAELWLRHPDEREELLLRSSEHPEAIWGALRATDPNGEIYDLTDISPGNDSGQFRRSRVRGRVLLCHGPRLETAYVEGLAARQATGVLCGPEAVPLPLYGRRFFSDPQSAESHRPFVFQLPPSAFARLATMPLEKLRLRCVIRASTQNRPLCLLRAQLGAEPSKLSLIVDLRDSPWCSVVVLALVRELSRLAPVPRIEILFVDGFYGYLNWLARQTSAGYLEGGPSPRIGHADPPFLVQIAARPIAGICGTGPASDCLREQLELSSRQEIAGTLPNTGGRRELVRVALPLGDGVNQTRELAASFGAAICGLSRLQPTDTPHILAALQLAGCERLLALARRLSPTHACTAPSDDSATARHALWEVEDQLGRCVRRQRQHVAACASLFGGQGSHALRYADTNAALDNQAATLQRMVRAQIRALSGDADLAAKQRPPSALERRAGRLAIERRYFGPLSDELLLQRLPLSERRWWLPHRAELPTASLFLEELSRLSEDPSSHATQAPDTRSHATQAPDTRSHATQAPDTRSHATQAPDTRSHATQAPDTRSHATQAPDMRSHATQAPDMRSHATQAPDMRSHATQAPDMRSHATQAPDAFSCHAGTGYAFSCHAGTGYAFSCHAGTGYAFSCHAGTGYAFSCHAGTGYAFSCHAGTGYAFSCHAGTGYAFSCHAGTGYAFSCHAGTGYAFSCHAGTGYAFSCHAGTGYAFSCHAGTGYAFSCHAGTGYAFSCHAGTGPGQSARAARRAFCALWPANRAAAALAFCRGARARPADRVERNTSYPQHRRARGDRLMGSACWATRTI
jgi:hypothetical protein